MADGWREAVRIRDSAAVTEIFVSDTDADPVAVVCAMYPLLSVNSARVRIRHITRRWAERIRRGSGALAENAHKAGAESWNTLKPVAIS